MKLLSDEIMKNAVELSDGKYGWRREYVFKVLNAIAESGQATLGGKVIVLPNDAIHQGLSNQLIPLWETNPVEFGESWADYCSRTHAESLLAFESKSEEFLAIELRQYVFYYVDYVEQQDIRNLIPRSKHDQDRAEAAIAAGYPAVDPILPDLLEWLQDMNWPVARTLAPFLASIGEPLIPHIRHIFSTDDEVWKTWIITEIMYQSPVVAKAFYDDLTRIAYSPTKSEETEELPLYATDLLKNYGLEQNNE